MHEYISFVIWVVLVDLSKIVSQQKPEARALPFRSAGRQFIARIVFSTLSSRPNPAHLVMATLVTAPLSSRSTVASTLAVMSYKYARRVYSGLRRRYGAGARNFLPRVYPARAPARSQMLPAQEVRISRGPYRFGKIILCQRVRETMFRVAASSRLLNSFHLIRSPVRPLTTKNVANDSQWSAFSSDAV